MMQNGKSYTLNLQMEIYTAEGLSAHSDRRQLLAYVGRLSSRPDRIICVHGEATKTVQLAQALNRIYRSNTFAPKNLETIRLK